MVWKKFYIPLTVLSILLIFLSFYTLLSTDTENHLTFSLEIDRVIHHDLNIPFTHLKIDEINTLLQDSVFSYPISETYLLMFISGSDPCSNCMNEITDYLNLANEVESISANFRSLLIYHGADEQMSKRFIMTSNISDLIHYSFYTEPSKLSNFDFGSFIQKYGTQNMLYLADMKENKIFQGFVLPVGKTTKLESKKIAFTNAINNHTIN